MSTTRQALESPEWRAEEFPLVIRWNPAVLDDIRERVVDGFYRLPHGGLEVGGVLYGFHRDEESGDPGKTQRSISIAAFRPFTLSYAFGPGFQVTPEDRSSIEAVIREEPLGADGGRLVPVGWYRSRNRTDLLLDERDLAFYNDCFPEPWQIALVLKPVRYEPTRAAFFFREEGGKLRADSPYDEILLTPLKRFQPGARPPVAPAAELPEETGLVARGGSRAAKLVSSEAIGEILEQSAEEGHKGPPGWRQPPEFPNASGSGEEPEEPEPAPPQPVPAFEPGIPWLRYGALALLVLILGVGGYSLALNWSTLSQRVAEMFEQRIGLRAVDREGQIEIAWNRVSRLIRDASGATLEINDGGVKTDLALDPEQLRSGSITYQRIFGDVRIRLSITPREGGAPIEEVTRFIGAPGQRPEPGPGTARASAAAPPVEMAAPVADRPAPPLPSPSRSTTPAPKPEKTTRAAPTTAKMQTPVAKPPVETQPANPPPAKTPATVAAGSPPKPQIRVEPSDSALVRPPPNAPAAQPSDSPARAEQRIAAQVPASNLPAREETPAAKATNPPANQPASAQPQPQRVETPKPAAPPPATAPAGPRAGRAIWTGQLSKGSTLVIANAKPSSGFLTGSIPAGPVQVSVQPAELSGDGFLVYSANPRYREAKETQEAPSQANGWNKTIVRYDPKKAADVEIVETPGGPNGRLVIRTKRNIAVMLIHWQAAQ